MNMQPWNERADRIRKNDGYTYADFARDLVQQLSWTGAVDVATALRGHVYGSPGRSELHADVRPLYDRLGWEQAALIAAWFRNLSNKPHRRQAGWPTSTLTNRTEIS
ncbi:hypothetical protein [Streptomyces mirabilis]|uniref:hypothetical protein n=1 Tax=Streptomyces mirabilis TaxID=68239 RepID=UPI0036DC703A